MFRNGRFPYYEGAVLRAVSNYLTFSRFLSVNLAVNFIKYVNKVRKSWSYV